MVLDVDLQDDGKCKVPSLHQNVQVQEIANTAFGRAGQVAIAWNQAFSDWCKQWKW